GVVRWLARVHFRPRPILGHSLTNGLTVLCPICGLVRSNSRAGCLVVRFRARFTVGVSAVLLPLVPVILVQRLHGAANGAWLHSSPPEVGMRVNRAAKSASWMRMDRPSL